MGGLWHCFTHISQSISQVMSWTWMIVSTPFFVAHEINIIEAAVTPLFKNLRTYCNKNFRGWIAGFHSFRRLIEIRTAGNPGIPATGSYSPLTGINIPHIDYWYNIKIKIKHMYIYIYVYESMARAAERFDSWCCQQGWRRQLQPDASRTHWRPFGPRGCPWLVLACLACAALFRALNQKTFRGLIFFPSHRLLCNLIPRQNGLSSPSMVEYLALSSVWKACTCYNFSGLENFFSNQLFSEPNTMPNWTFKPWHGGISGP